MPAAPVPAFDATLFTQERCERVRTFLQETYRVNPGPNGRGDVTRTSMWADLRRVFPDFIVANGQKMKTYGDALFQHLHQHCGLAHIPLENGQSRYSRNELPTLLATLHFD